MHDEAVALVVEYGGNLVGLGEKEVVVPIEELEFPGGQDHIETTMTDEQLASLDPWDE